MKSIVSETIDFHVQFYDCDPMAICWHGNYVRYFEKARCALLKKIDYDYPDMKASGYAWPVIDVNVRYVRAIKYDQHIKITASLVEYEHYLLINYLITDFETGERLSKGSTKQVAVTGEGFDMQLISPPIVRQKLEKFL